MGQSCCLIGIIIFAIVNKQWNLLEIITSFWRQHYACGTARAFPCAVINMCMSLYMYLRYRYWKLSFVTKSALQWRGRVLVHYTWVLGIQFSDWTSKFIYTSIDIRLQTLPNTYSYQWNRCQINTTVHIYVPGAVPSEQGVSGWGRLCHRWWGNRRLCKFNGIEISYQNLSKFNDNATGIRHLN